MSDASAGSGPVLETSLVAAPPAPAATPAIGVGAVLSRTFRVWWAHAGAFAAMSLVVYAPLVAGFALVFGWALEMSQGGAPPPTAPELARRFGLLGVGALATTALSVVQMGAVTYATVRHLDGEGAPFGRMLAVGLRRGLPVVGTGFVVWMVFLAGALALLAPGLVWLVAASVAVPAAVVERPGVLGAIRRSFELTRGSRWQLFAAGLVVVVVMWVVSAAVQIAATVLVVLLPPPKALAATLVLSQVGNALFSVIPVVAVAICYHDLRVAKEGVDTAALARVFE